MFGSSTHAPTVPEHAVAEVENSSHAPTVTEDAVAEVENSAKSNDSNPAKSLLSDKVNKE